MTMVVSWRQHWCQEPSNKIVTTVESKVIKPIYVHGRKATSLLVENVIIVAERTTKKPFAGANRKMKARSLHILRPRARKKLQEPRLIMKSWWVMLELIP